MFSYCCHWYILIKSLLNGRYVPDATYAVYDVLKEISKFHASKKRRYEEEEEDVLRKVQSRSITKETLKEMLAQYVEKVTLSHDSSSIHNRETLMSL